MKTKKDTLNKNIEENYWKIYLLIFFAFMLGQIHIIAVTLVKDKFGLLASLIPFTICMLLWFVILNEIRRCLK